MSTTSILGVIQHYQRSIEKSQTDEARLLHCISKLYKLPIKVEHLQETGIGKTVNSLRKFDGEIGTAAKTLVAKWKAVVAAEEEPMETTCHQDDPDKSNGKGNDSDNDDDDDHNDLNKNTEVNDNSKPHSGTQKTQNSSKDREHRSDVKQRDESERSSKNSSSSKSHHRSTSSNAQMEVIRHRYENKPSSSSINKNKECKTDKQHRSLEKNEKSDQKHEKAKDSYDSSDKKQDKQKEVSSSNHKTSKPHKEENSDSNETHHHNSKREKNSHNDQKEAAHHRESVKHETRSSSSSKEKDRNSQKHDSHKHEKHKSSSKDDRVEKHEKQKSGSKDQNQIREHDNDKKKHSSSNKHTSTSASSSTKATKDKPSSSSEASSERKRKHNSDQETNKAKSPTAKMPKRNKVVDENNEEEEDNEEGIDSSMGANFADVLGMLNMPGKKLKKVSNTIKSPPEVASTSSGSKNSSQPKDSSRSNLNGMKPSTSSSLKKLETVAINKEQKPDLLSSSTKLEPLDPSIAMELPTISTNYRPLPLSQNVLDVVFPSSSISSNAVKPPVRTLTDAEALSHGISSKTMRTKIYSGVRTGQLLQVPSLFDLCIRVLQKNIDALEYTGGVPFEVLRPVLERASPQQLLVFEEYNPYLMEDCDILWQHHVQRHYRAHKRLEMESWREMFLRCQEDQERKLNILAESIKQSQKIISAPVRKTQLAFVDSMVKPPRNVQRKQEQFGTKSKLTATPAARVAALSNVTPNAAKTGDARLRVAASVRDNAQVVNIVRPLKKAPLMAKTLQFMRGRHKR